MFSENYKHEVFIQPREDYLDNLRKTNSYLYPVNCNQSILITDVKNTDKIWSGPDYYGFHPTSEYIKRGIDDIFLISYKYSREDTKYHIICTEDQKFGQLNGGLVELYKLKVGDGLLLNTGQPGYCFSPYELEITDIEYVGKSFVGSLQVENSHRFSCNGIICGDID